MTITHKDDFLTKTWQQIIKTSNKNILDVNIYNVSGLPNNSIFKNTDKAIFLSFDYNGCKLVSFAFLTDSFDIKSAEADIKAEISQFKEAINHSELIYLTFLSHKVATLVGNGDHKAISEDIADDLHVLFNSNISFTDKINTMTNCSNLADFYSIFGLTYA